VEVYGVVPIQGWHGRLCPSIAGGLVFKAHRLLYHSTLGLRAIKKKKKVHALVGRGVLLWRSQMPFYFPGTQWVSQEILVNKNFVPCNSYLVANRNRPTNEAHCVDSLTFLSGWSTGLFLVMGARNLAR